MTAKYNPNTSHWDGDRPVLFVPTDGQGNVSPFFCRDCAEQVNRDIEPRYEDDLESFDRAECARCGDVIFQGERPRAEVNTHTIVIDRLVDEKHIERYRWRFAIEDRTVVGWSRSDIQYNGTEDPNHASIDDLPDDVRRALEDELGIDDLDEHRDLPEHLQEGGHGV